MDKDIEKLVKLRKMWDLLAKAILIKVSNCPDTDKPWTRLHIHLTGPMNGLYLVIIVDVFTKWLEVLK